MVKDDGAVTEFILDPIKAAGAADEEEVDDDEEEVEEPPTVVDDDLCEILRES